MAKKQVKKSNVGEAVAVGASIAALTAAAYVLFGPEGKKNRKAIKGWTVKMKGELIEKLEQAKEITEPVYHSIVDQVSAKYAKQKGVSEEELNKLVSEVRKHWKSMQRDAKPVAKKAGAAVKKAVKK